MTSKKVSNPALMRYLLLGLVGVVVVYVGAGFIRQAQVRARQRAELERLEQQILRAQEEAAVLEEQLEFVKSPAAVEAWAFENGWARPDQVLVAIIEPSGEPSAASDMQGEDKAGPVPQQAWWDLFFGDR